MKIQPKYFINYALQKYVETAPWCICTKGGKQVGFEKVIGFLVFPGKIVAKAAFD